LEALRVERSVLQLDQTDYRRDSVDVNAVIAFAAELTSNPAKWLSCRNTAQGVHFIALMFAIKKIKWEGGSLGTPLTHFTFNHLAPFSGSAVNCGDPEGTRTLNTQIDSLVL
tara:strand:- start:324 stop:659 length:336 start_codon:yes stop_codon:yes gene_type:complete